MSKILTPVMKQFTEAKKNHPNSIMLFRMGDFYETFEDDALVASEVLGITLTKRANGAASAVPLAGFPYHSLDQYLYKLLKAGHRVAICEQVEDPKHSKGIVKREVVEVLSPGTAIADKYLDQKENNFLCSLILDKNECGISILDYSTGEFYACSRNKDDLVSIIKQFNVSEIIIPENQIDDLKAIIKSEQYFITGIPEWRNSYSTAFETITSFFNVTSLKGFGFEEDSLSVISAGSSLYYVDKNYKGKTKHIQNISIIKQTGVMGLDGFTIRNLEIFESLSSKGIKGTLIGTIDKTITGSGSRLIKNWLRRPLTDPKKINKRLDYLSEFIKKPKTLESTQNFLKETSDLERILAKVSIGKASPRDVLNIGLTLFLIPTIKQNINKNTKNLNLLVKQFVNTDKICELINNTIKNDPPSTTKNGGYIIEGVSKELDENRLLAKDASKWMADMQKKEQLKNNIPSLKIGYNRVFGYYLEVTKTHIDKVPDYFIRKQTLTNSERYFTSSLKEYEEKILSAKDKIIELELEIYEDIQKQILNFKDAIQQNARILAQLDVVSALSRLAIDNNYTRPEINSKDKLFIKNGRHPVVEDLLSLGDDFVPNDLNLNNKDIQIAIITGPNMAGKSTYLRQVGLIQILAQIGSFIPADSAILGVVDKVFTRVGASDNLAGGESTFLVEMNETANILNNATNKSLILLDEIGRGTSTYDGLALAWAVTEYIHNNEKLRSKTLFATHYHELVSLAEELPKAQNLNVSIKEFDDKIIFLKKIVLGGASKSYGVHVAEMAGLPKAVVYRARDILNQQSSKDRGYIPDTSMDLKAQMELFSKLEESIKIDLEELNINEMTPLDALKKLEEIKIKYDL